MHFKHMNPIEWIEWCSAYVLHRSCFFGPLSMEDAFFVDTLVGVSAEVVALGLSQVLW